MLGIESIPRSFEHHTTRIRQSQEVAFSPFDSRLKGGYKEELVNDSITPLRSKHVRRYFLSFSWLVCQ